MTKGIGKGLIPLSVNNLGNWKNIKKNSKGNPIY